MHLVPFFAAVPLDLFHIEEQRGELFAAPADAAHFFHIIRIFRQISPKQLLQVFLLENQILTLQSAACLLQVLLHFVKIAVDQLKFIVCPVLRRLNIQPV